MIFDATKYNPQFIRFFFYISRLKTLSRMNVYIFKVTLIITPFGACVLCNKGCFSGSLIRILPGSGPCVIYYLLYNTSEPHDEYIHTP